HAAASLESPAVMGTSPGAAAARLAADPAMADRFRAVEGRGPDADALVDALAAFEATLLTPGARFDRWLLGEADALSPLERRGYALFRSVGCISCHQGVGVGGNLFQRHGVFAPLASPHPAVVRVPSLRNVAATAPYFHDGGAATLPEAVRRMARSQLGAALRDEDVAAIVAWLGTLTGRWRGRPVEAPR
ncbi:MAG: cytochrome c peroxidase, partial [Pseudomonadota bacterium]|nr:cytochrome c peroxidase [Pseudomonadota bacterium]